MIEQLSKSDLTIFALTAFSPVPHKATHLKPSQHVAKVAARANSIIGLVKKNFDYLDSETILSIHTTIIRPMLEYAVQSWCPYQAKDIEELEKIQHRITKLVPGFQDLPYDERCRRLKLPKLSERRDRGDLIQGVKSAHFAYPAESRPTQFFKILQITSSLSRSTVDCKSRYNVLINYIYLYKKHTVYIYIYLYT